MYNNKISYVNVEFTLMDLLKGISSTEDMYKKSIALAYLAYTSSEDIYEKAKNDLRDILDLVHDKYIKNFLSDALVDVPIYVLEKTRSMDKEELKAFILFSEDKSSRFGGEFSTPKCLTTLALNLLDIKKDEKVLDSCSGTGTFLTQAFLLNNKASYYGIELNTRANSIAYIRAEILGKNVVLRQGNALENVFGDMKFDKAFSNYPFGMQLRYLPNSTQYLEEIKYKNPELTKITSVDWLFNYNLVNELTENGTAVAVMTLGSLWNTIDKPIREYFIKNKLIQTVIALPSKLFSYTSIAVALVVFGRGKSDAIRFVDASNLFVEGRRQNTLTEKNINEIIYSINSDTDISKEVMIEEIAENDFVLNPSRYLTEKLSIKNGVKFSTCIKTITRGAPLRANELDNLVSKVSTDYKYLMLANIKNGIIDDDLPYVKEIESKYEKYCVKNNSLLISKNGYPFKVALAQVPEGKKLLANGNLYIIELDEEKVDPHYIKAFFESELGIASLKSIAVGATVLNIGVSQLKKLLIPMIPMEQQKVIALKYLATLDQIELLRRKISKTENLLKTIFNSEE